MQHKEVDFYLMSGTGVDNVRTVIELGIKTGVINKGGAWYRWNSPNGEIKGQGLASFTEQLSEEDIDTIWNEVKPFLSEPNKSKPLAEDSEDLLSDL